ncbi:hypothetical protein OIU84_029231 [Salix udensis]|uniref:Uncharacterized protein n=1 Tax=Salix udensis TaxID=889485 RepID=A0AAD6P801_9ROSI|nr:hypothetical protein OIU84_029231 [Salix udensis]
MQQTSLLANTKGFFSRTSPISCLHAIYAKKRLPSFSVLKTEPSFAGTVMNQSIQLVAFLRNHQRFLATGIRVALSSSCSKDTQKSSLEPPNQSEQRPSVKLPSPGFGSSWAVDDFLQFSDFEESTDKKEQLGMGGEFDWLADMGLFR